MPQPNMSKKLLRTLIDSKIAFNQVTLIGEICGGRFLHIICATCQSKKQKDYPKKKFLFIHSNDLRQFILIFKFLGFKGAQAWKEVDFILEQGKKLLAFEVKCMKKPTFDDIRNLITFMEENPETMRGVLLHAGTSIKWLHSKVLAVPWWWIAT